MQKLLLILLSLPMIGFGQPYLNSTSTWIVTSGTAPPSPITSSIAEYSIDNLLILIGTLKLQAVKATKRPRSLKLQADKATKRPRTLNLPAVKATKRPRTLKLPAVKARPPFLVKRPLFLVDRPPPATRRH